MENGFKMLHLEKNKTDVNSSSEFDFDPEGYGNDLDGVDLNRNYDFNWFFEIQSILLMEDVQQIHLMCLIMIIIEVSTFFRKRSSCNSRFRNRKAVPLSIAYHSSRSWCVAERVIYPWLWEGGKAAPDFTVISTLGQEIAELIDVEVGDGNYHHAASGSRKGNAHDWFYSQTGCIQYLIEVATENMQPFDVALIDDTVDRNLKGAYHLLKELQE